MRERKRPVIDALRTKRNCLVRRVGGDGKTEEGPYMVIEGKWQIPGEGLNPIQTLWVRAREIDTNGYEPVITKNRVRIDPRSKVRLIGKFMIEE
jgi:hypothetical protein